MVYSAPKEFPEGGIWEDAGVPEEFFRGDEREETGVVFLLSKRTTD